MQISSIISSCFSKSRQELSNYLIIPVLLISATSSIQAQDYALNFNGSSQYVNCGAGNLAITGASPRTVEAWVYTRSFNDAGVFQMGTPGNILGEFTLRTTTADNLWVMQIWTNDFNFTIPNSKNNWIHFAISYDGTTIKIYANGVEVASADRTLNTLSDNFYMGRWAGGWFDGMVDEVAVYNYARSQAEIQATMNVERSGSESGLLAYYRGNLSGTTLLDYSANAQHGAVFNGSVNVSGVFQPTGAGTSGDPYLISNLNNLYWVSANTSSWNKTYLQTANIDASLTSLWYSGAGWSPVGNESAAFTGVYNGGSYSINGLTINRPSQGFLGLFGVLTGGSCLIHNVNLSSVLVNSQGYSGSIAGKNYGSTIRSCFSSGSVSGTGDVGGIAGQNVEGLIENCGNSADVTGTSYSVGGVVGYNSGTVRKTFNTGIIVSAEHVGGIAGYTNTYSIIDCYSTGSVTATSQNAGGLVGAHTGGATIYSSYATGSVTSPTSPGGLIGLNSGGGTVSNSMWDTQTTGQSSSAGGTSQSTEAMKLRPTFTDAGWDFKDAGTNDVWNIGNNRNNGYPYLDWQYPSDPVVAIPTLTTTAISDINTTSASSGGSISSDGGGSVTARGVCWSSSSNPTINDSYTTDGTGTGSFSSALSGLSTSTTYYVRSYASNLAGTAYGNQQTFTTWDAMPTFSAAVSSYDFGTLLVGRSSQQTITITNYGGGYLNISAVSDPGVDYEITPTSASIAGSGNQVFTLTFAPLSGGSHNGSLAFTDNDGNHTIAISGAGQFQAQADAGSCVYFDGIDDHIQTDLDVQPSALTTTTWETWIKPNRLNFGSFQGILCSDDGGWDRGIWVWPNSNQLVVGYGTNGWLTTPELAEGTWYHIAVVYKSDNVLFYLNGEEYSLGTAPSGQVTTQNLRMGGDAGGQDFQGEIDEVRIWNDIRTPAEIRGNFGSLAGNEDGLIGYWRLDEGSGVSTGDGSGNGHIGTLANSPIWVTSSVASVESPVFSASPGSHDFGSVLVGRNDQQTIVVTNTNGGFLIIDSVIPATAAYTVTPSSANIGVGASQNFTVTFEPTSSGVQSGNLTFVDNAGDHTVNITGMGIFQAQADGGNAVSLDGVDDYLEIPGVNATDNMTMEFWVKPANLPATGTSNTFLLKGDMAENKSFYTDQYQDGLFVARVVTSVTFSVSLGDAPVGEWTHFAFSYNGSALKGYKNGVVAEEVSATGSIISSPNTLVIGHKWSETGWGSDAFDGQVDEIRLWNTARTQSQIQGSFASLAGNEAGLVGYWRFDEGSGSISGDGTGNAVNANLLNSPSWQTTSAPVEAPIYQASSSSLAIGGVNVGETANGTVTITNNGGGVLNISSITIDDAQFSVSPSSANLSAGTSAVLTVTFEPSNYGDKTGTLTLTHNPNAATHTISLSGSGKDGVFSPSVSELPFGDVQVNTQGQQVLTVTNSGSLDLSISEIVCDPTLFTLSPTTASIGIGSSQEFTVTFSPTSLGSTSGTITFTHDGDASPSEVTLTANSVILYGAGTLGSPYQIANLSDLQFIITNSSYWDKRFIQTADINANSTNIGPVIGNTTTPFTGTYNGAGHTISNFKKEWSSGTFLGLFGFISGSSSVIENLGLPNAYVLGSSVIGGLTGKITGGTIRNCYVTGTVFGFSDYVGGLAGATDNATIVDCHTSVAATARSIISGGLIGIADNNTTITSCMSSGTVMATSAHGGGLVGNIVNSTVSNCYSRSTSRAGNVAGGLIATISSGSVSSSFSAGLVECSGTSGGLIGLNGSSAPVTDSFWDTQTSAHTTSAGGSGMTTAEMKIKSNFVDAGWDFKGETANGENEYWNIGNSRNDGYPYLDIEYPDDPAINTPALTTSAISVITTTTATAGGVVVDDVHGQAVTARGVCWGTSENPTTGDTKTTDGSGSGSFTSEITGLSANTLYHVRAYATNLAGTSYGADLSFTTLGLAYTSTQAVSNVDTVTSTGNGTITSLGNPTPSQHGLCWSTTENPTTADSKTEEGEVATTGAFTSTMTGLSPNTTYHARSYVINSVGTSYGDDVSFTTLQLPVVTTQVISNLAASSVTAHGTVTVVGNPNPSQHGVCWSTSETPTIADSRAELGEVSTAGSFTYDVTGLTVLTTYYLRAYITNTVGTDYGEQVSFITNIAEPTVQALNLVIGDPGAGQMTLSWTNGNGSKRAVFIKTASSGSAEPVDNTTYTASTVFGSGTQIGATGWFCVYNGEGTAVTVSDLPNGESYQVMACEYNGSAGGENYYSSNATNNPANYALPYFLEETGITFIQNQNSESIFGDIDSDGDLDVLVYGNTAIELFKNNGDQTFTKLSDHGIDYYTAYHQPLSWNDYDNDGFIDLLMTIGATLNVYRNNGDLTFSKTVTITFPGFGYKHCYSYWIDYNNDGYTDIFVTGNNDDAYTKMYMNNGDGTFTIQESLSFDQFYYSSAACGDYDNDGYTDIFVTGIANSTRTAVLYKNNGGLSFTAQTSDMPWTPVINSYASWYDYNGDSFLDLTVVGKNYSTSYTKLYKNNGDNTFSWENTISLEPVYDPAISWGDFDADGDADLIISGKVSSTTNKTRLYENMGNNTFTQQLFDFPNVGNGALKWGDYDNDNDLDLLITGQLGSTTGLAKLYENIGSAQNTAPSAPTNLQVAVAENITFTWDKATDSQTSQNGLRYSLFIGSTASQGDLLPSLADISNGKRYVLDQVNTALYNAYTFHNPPGGNYFWGVQAIDAGLAGSVFAGGTFSSLGPASNVEYSNNLSDRMTIGWTNGINGSNRFVFVKEGDSGSPVLNAETDYSANAQFGAGTQVASSGWYCVYSGSGSSVVVNGVSPNTTYRAMVVEVGGAGESRFYIDINALGNPRNRYPLVPCSGNALSFDGANDRVSANPDMPVGSYPFTIETWIQIENTSSANKFIASWGVNQSDYHIYQLRFYGDRYLRLSSDMNTVEANFPSGIGNGWNHIAAAFDGTTLRLYLNGVECNSGSFNGSSWLATQDFTIGAMRGSATSYYNHFPGKMDEMRIWDIARTQTEISTNMCNKLNPGTTSNLISYYDFDASGGETMLYDRKNPAGDGTLMNFGTEKWVKSGAMVGNGATLLASTSTTTLGSAGQCCRATITSTPNTSNFLNLYQHVSGLGAVLEPDVGSWPAGIVKRADIIWGVHSVGTVTANLVFDYSQIGGIDSPELIRLIKRSSGCSEWEDVSSEFSHNTAARTFSIVGNSSFSEYSVATQDGDNSLPVELSEFSVRQELKTVSLKWITDSEIENLGFILEKQNDEGRHEIATYLTHEGLGGQGSTNETSAYEFIDDDLSLGMEYRCFLYDVDYQGERTLLDSVSIILDETEWERIPDEFSLGMLYPNPFNPQITIPLALAETADVQLLIYDIRGREVINLVNGQMAPGRHQLIWTGKNTQGKPVASGIYLLSCRIRAQESGKQLNSTQKILKLE